MAVWPSDPLGRLRRPARRTQSRRFAPLFAGPSLQTATAHRTQSGVPFRSDEQRAAGARAGPTSSRREALASVSDERTGRSPV